MTTLPIDAVLPDLMNTLLTHKNAVLVAPPGAGKTTRVPLAFLDVHWATNKRILMLEPRRIAARAAAERMAKSLGEKVGERVGLRVRLGSKISSKTRIEVMTEGVFTRMILDDPALETVAAVIFDEFHERSLDADFGLALALDAQSGLREDLRLLVMSATLDGARVAALMQGAPVIHSEGQAFPVETHYWGRHPTQRIEEQISHVVEKLLRSEAGSLLVFLPGQGEIRRVEQLLKERLNDPSVLICPLYGALSPADQDRAVSPSRFRERKIVLATSIAETSLTIENVRIVVDSGLARVPVYEPDIGVTRLVTKKVSRASADQRRGRAGRTEAGICIRLWEEAGHQALEAFTQPEILSADLSALVLDCALWGVADPCQLGFLDTPPAMALKEARLVLQQVGALDHEFRLTELGRHLNALPLPPHLASMLLQGSRIGQGRLASQLAALLVERGLGGDLVDLDERLRRFQQDRSPKAQDMRRLADGWAKAAQMSAAALPPLSDFDVSDSVQASEIGFLLALAYPDRIAKSRSKRGEYLLRNGRGAVLEAHSSLAEQPFLVVAELTGKAAASRILSAASLSREAVDVLAQKDMVVAEDVRFDIASSSVRGRSYKKLGALVLDEHNLSIENHPLCASILAKGLAQLPFEQWPWSKTSRQWRDRVMFLRKTNKDIWPDLSEQILRDSLGIWLAPFLAGKTALSQISDDDFAQGLYTLLPWELARRLDEEAPTHFTVPTGSSIAIDYSENDPVLSVRVQELFGLAQHPSLAQGRVPLLLHLLSPAHRPLQITRDLPGFWKGSWADVKAHMRGRYPKHSWPDDPLNAQPTSKTKKKTAGMG
jgi:ATP-dependent helicase HrpB